MTLTEMRYIVALARERHFGKAADACHVSQPTLSVALKKAEQRYGITLFERSSADVRLTPLGEQIVRQAQQVAAGIVLRDQAEHGLGRVMQALPGGLCDVLGQRGGAKAAVERVVAVPERAPLNEVTFLDCTNFVRLGHSGS